MHCVSAVTKALQALASVADVEVSLEQGTAKLVYDPSIVTIEQMLSAIEEQGFEAVPG
ncbi:MAG: cation transporter [Symbiobacteriaceae bacterium]|nr:cation transporter [Symbiobacteriaceae bacterium]